MKKRIMNRDKLILLVLVLMVLAFNYPYLNSFLENAFSDYEYGIVERVIDGDTLSVNGTSVRLLGINSPEKGEIGYDEAKNFLSEKVLNNEVKLTFGKDKSRVF